MVYRILIPPVQEVDEKGGWFSNRLSFFGERGLPGEAYLKALLQRVEKDGPVFRLQSGAVGIFDPSLALEVERANSADLKLPGSLSGIAGKRDGADNVSWREARSLLIQRSRELTAPRHLSALHERMRAVFERAAGQPQDLTALTVRTFSHSLQPLIIAGLPQRSTDRILAGQEANFRGLSGAADVRRGLRQRIADVITDVAIARAIAKQLNQRLKGAAPPRDDYAQAILPLVGRIGPSRATYLVTTLLTAASSPPGIVASCILYELATRPDWRERVRAELSELADGELHAVPARKLPITTRFIKEALRLWTFPLVAHRIAYRDIEAGGESILAGTPYDLSPFVIHHSDRFWRNPERFDPDRWLDAAELPPANAFVPFGFGPRSCIGASVGNSQLILYCHLVACEFETELASNQQPTVGLEGFAIPRNLIGTVRLRS